MIDFRLNPDLDLDRLARIYREESRVRIPRLLTEGAEPLRDYLAGCEDWWHLVSTEDDVLEFSRAARARMSGRRRSALDAEVHERARLGFQYRYEGLRVPEEDEEDWAAGDDPLAAFARLMSSEAMLAMLRTVTGAGSLAFADGQATAYGPGDFLTCHDDDVAGKNRVAAYVFGLTPRWRPEWGGLLLFHPENSGPMSAHVPSFNTLDLFKVPQRHSVSIVTPSAMSLRYSVTGWLHARGRAAVDARRADPPIAR